LTDSKAIDEFYGRLKDPYYDRPVSLTHDAPTGAVICLYVEKTGEAMSFIKLGHSEWGAYGTNTEFRGDYSTKQLENLIFDYIIVAQRQKGHVSFTDPGNYITVHKSARIDHYV